MWQRRDDNGVLGCRPGPLDPRILPNSRQPAMDACGSFRSRHYGGAGVLIDLVHPLDLNVSVGLFYTIPIQPKVVSAGHSKTFDYLNDAFNNRRRTRARQLPA